MVAIESPFRRFLRLLEALCVPACSWRNLWRPAASFVTIGGDGCDGRVTGCGAAGWHVPGARVLITRTVTTHRSPRRLLASSRCLNRSGEASATCQDWTACERS